MAAESARDRFHSHGSSAPMSAPLGTDSSYVHKGTDLPNEGSFFDRLLSGMLFSSDQARGIAAALFYVVMSFSMVFVNKSLPEIFDFSHTNLLLVMQFAFTIILLRVSRDVFHLVDFQDFDTTKARIIAPVSLFYVGNVALGLLSLRILKVPSFNVVKQLNPVFVIMMDFVVAGKRTGEETIRSVLLLVVGAVLCANHDAANGDLLGWIVGVVACLMQATYLVLIKSASQKAHFGTFDITYYHCILSLPLLTPVMFVTGEFSEAMQYQHWSSGAFLTMLFIFNLFGFFLNFSIFLSTNLNSPLTTAVAGQIKGFASTIVGFFTFGGVTVSMTYIVGVLINVCGGWYYAYLKYQERARTIMSQKAMRDVEKGAATG